MTDKIVLSHVYKIFGDDPEEALRMIEQGKDKQEIFEKTGQTLGVRDASFAVQEGEIFVVMGLSGSGKSTLVRMLNRLIETSSGEILVDGRDVTKMSKKELIQLRRRDMSMVFQSFALMPHKTVAENASFGLDVAGRDKSNQRKKALEALDAVGLKAWADSYPSELSGGMKQRVGLARALANDPTIMLMDEAFSALDPLIRTEMQDELLRLQGEQARTVVFISHDLDEAMRIGDRIAIMEGGRIVQVGTPDEIVQNPADDYVRSFFRNVDVTQVYTAGDIARRQTVTVIERPGSSFPSAIETLREHDRDQAVIIDKNRKYQGLVTAETLIEEKKRSAEPSFQNAFVPDVEPIAPDMPLSDVLTRVAQSRWVVPGVDENGKYLGAISKTALLQTLDKAS